MLQAIQNFHHKPSSLIGGWDFAGNGRLAVRWGAVILAGVAAAIAGQSGISADGIRGDAQPSASGNSSEMKSDTSGNRGETDAFPWTTVTADTQMAGNNGYVAGSEHVLTLTLPPSTSLSAGDCIRVRGMGAGGWKIVQNDGQSVFVELLQVPDFSGVWTDCANAREWACIASSADGGTLVAGVSGGSGGQLFVSRDGGITWTQRMADQWWYDLASSADGVNWVGVTGGYIYTSSDSGATWTARMTDTRRDWKGVASSSDGAMLVAGANAGHAFTSGDSGATWMEQPESPDTDWAGVVSSADGLILAVYDLEGWIWRSTDAGIHWTKLGSPRNCHALAASDDGVRLVACAGPGQLWTSMDSGASWTAREKTQMWRAVVSSANGCTLAALDGNGCIHYSGDSGMTWHPRSPAMNVRQMAMPADGTKIAVANSPGNIRIMDSHGKTFPYTPAGTGGYIARPAGFSVALRYEGDGKFRVESYTGLRPGLETAAGKKPAGACLTDWLVAGPVSENAPGEILLSLLGGAGARQREGALAPGCEGAWTRYRGDGNIVNLRTIAGFSASAEALAFCEIESDSNQQGRVYCFTPNAFKLWVNGDFIFEKPEGLSEALRWEAYNVELRRGVNSCLVMCRTDAAPFFGFALRADGPEATPAPPLIWDPAIPGASVAEEGRYALLSPEWRWRAGDDPAWAAPDWDDSGWEPLPATAPPELKAGTPYWMRIRGHFASHGAGLPYTFEALHSRNAAMYLEGHRLDESGVLAPFRNRYRAVELPREGVLAVRAISPGPGEPLAGLAVRRADRRMADELYRLTPEKYHGVFLTVCFALCLTYCLFIYGRYAARTERAWPRAVLALALLAAIALDLENGTGFPIRALWAWISLIFAAAAAVSGIAMVQIALSGAVEKRALAVYGAVAAGLLAGAGVSGLQGIALLIYPVTALESIRLCLWRSRRPGRPNRAYLAVALLLFGMGQCVAACFLASNGTYFAGMGPYAHLYALLGLLTPLIVYRSRELLVDRHAFQSMKNELEVKIAERTHEVKLLTRQVLSAEETERERLARELHDGVAQTLCFAKMAAENITPETCSAQKNDVVELLEKSIKDVRAIAYGLRPPELDKLGFIQAISHCCEEFSNATGIFLDYEAHAVDNIALDPVAEVTLYRVLQEALNNIHRHANASRVRVRLVGVFPSVILRVEDNGDGFDVAQQQAKAGEGMGLRNMEERAHLAGGTMRIRTAPGEGMRLIFEVPQREEQA